MSEDVCKYCHGRQWLIRTIARGQLVVENCRTCNPGSAPSLAKAVIDIQEMSQIWPDLVAFMKDIVRVMEMADYCLKPDVEFTFDHHIDKAHALLKRIRIADYRTDPTSRTSGGSGSP